MMRRVKTCSALLTAALLLSGSVRAASPAPTNAAPASPVSATATNKVVARGKGWEITRGELGKGEHVFQTRIQCEKTGRFGYTVRILPSHSNLVCPIDSGLISWA